MRNKSDIQGNNRFNLKKRETALDDANYAKTLFRRWKHHVIKVTKTLKKMGTPYRLVRVISAMKVLRLAQTSSHQE
ncbi:hypothetical protein GN244_ATG09126 [Phytophthora infestans]|uniref:Uncharacterized protein n=1 Tax=Phytophthora infestans TaxID=4787 RepID=A0A833T8W9_PHYIN|nr:hypothetical protein GN244_ATG09126 [Phytophthora infestans]